MFASRKAAPAQIEAPRTHYVRQGELKVLAAGDDDWVGTLLGSCVALCLRDPFTGVGGLNHFLLPTGGQAGLDQASTRYGGYAIEMLINGMMRLGGERRRFEAKIFGGAKMMNMGGRGIGAQNVDFVREFCELEEIPVLAADVRGENARKLLYQPSSGRARVLRLGEKIKRSLNQREQNYGARLAKGRLSGDTELFE